MGLDSQLDFIGPKGVELSLTTEQEIARACRSRHQALVKSYEASCLTPKQLQAGIKASQSTVSKILTGAAFPDPDSYFDWMAVCNNLIPFRYDAAKLNHTITPVPVGLESRVQQLEHELAEERRLVSRLAQMLRGQ